MEKKSGSTQSTGKISVQLLRILIPMIALFIISVAVILYVNSRSIIIDQGMSRLEEESKANSNDIAGTMANIVGYYDGLSDLLESSSYSSNDEIKAALLPGMKKYPGMVDDVYIAFPDKSFIDGGEWIPGDDYDPTTRAWYQEGLKNHNITEAVIENLGCFHYRPRRWNYRSANHIPHMLHSRGIGNMRFESLLNNSPTRFHVKLINLGINIVNDI